VHFRATALQFTHAIDGPDHFAGAVSYAHKMFVKLTTGVNVIKLFFYATDGEFKYASVCHWQAFTVMSIFCR